MGKGAGGEALATPTVIIVDANRIRRPSRAMIQPAAISADLCVFTTTSEYWD